MTKGFNLYNKLNLLGKINFARAANEQRDRGNWNAAADLYTQFLDSVGRNKLTFGYVVQLGNCLKEARRYDEALAAYDAALAINDRNSDLYLQRGHLYKLMGNTPASAWAYQKAFNLDPANHHAQHEIEISGGRAVASFDLAQSGNALRTIWFDVTDFIDYARHNVSLSGIQRVCGNLMLSVEEMQLQGYRVVPVMPEYDTGRFLAVRYDSFIQLVRLFHKPHVHRDEVLRSVKTIESQRSVVHPSAGDIFMIAGAFWIVSRYDRVAELRRHGMKFGLFIHDLIQIRNKDYVMPDAVDRFNIQLSDALELCDFVLTNSRYVRDDVELYLRETKQLDLPVRDVLLPTELGLAQAAYSADLDDPKLQFVLEHDYVLIVSTIEVRKNHKLLIRVWEQLREEMGESTPKLVFVGKWGWQIDELHHYIDEQGYEDDWLFIFNGISDVTMEALYKGAMFTVYPSFAEGFGLPIGESLAYGKPCIASATTAMPEVGGDFVRYFDPFDWQTALPVIRQPIADRNDLHQWQERIAKDFKPRLWSDFCAEFYSATIACSEARPSDSITSLPLLPACELLIGGNNDVLVAAAEKRPIVTFRAARAHNWHACEEWGTWSSDRRSEIAFRTHLAEGEKADVFLRLHRPPSSDCNPIALIDDGADTVTISLGQHPTFYRLTTTVKAGGKIRLKLLARGKFAGASNASIYIGWTGLAYCRHENADDLAITMSQLLLSGESRKG